MTDPASAEDDDFCTCEPDPAGVELHNGWTLVAPPGTSRAAAEYAARRLYDDDYLPDPDDAEAAAEAEARQAERDAIGPMHGPVTHHQHMVNEMLKDTLNGLLGTPRMLSDFMFSATDRAQKFGTVVYETTNPGTGSYSSWLKDQFMDGPPPRGSLERAQYEGNWLHDERPTDEIPGWRETDMTDWAKKINDDADELMYGGHTHRYRVTEPVYGHIAVVGNGGVLHHYASYIDSDGTIHRDFTAIPELAALAAKWAENPPARPGWTGSITGPPRPIPVKPTPWETLPKGMLIERGADNNPNARIAKLKNGRWVDAGPAFPDGLAPAYRGRPAPLPWHHPDADPVADMKRAIEETP